MYNNTDTKKSYGDFDLEKATLDLESHPHVAYNTRKDLQNTQPDILQNTLGFLSKKIAFRFKPEYSLHLDTRKLLIRSLLMLLIEYCIHFTFQMIGYFSLNKFWRDSTYIPAIILGIVYAVLAVLLVVLAKIKTKMLLYLLKVLEFLTAFFLLGYLAAWDFGCVSLSYMIILNILIIFFFVS